MYKFAHVKHFGCSRNFESLRNHETKGFEPSFQNKTLQAMLNQEGKKYFILLYHTFQRLRQDLPKLMIPQELSTRYGIKLMLAIM